MDYEDFFDWGWRIALLVAILAAVGLGVKVAAAPKNVDYYYLSHSNGSQVATCVYAHWTWHTDEVAFCTDDAVKALDFATKANADLHRR